MHFSEWLILITIGLIRLLSFDLFWSLVGTVWAHFCPVGNDPQRSNAEAPILVQNFDQFQGSGHYSQDELTMLYYGY